MVFRFDITFDAHQRRVEYETLLSIYLMLVKGDVKCGSYTFDIDFPKVLRGLLSLPYPLLRARFSLASCIFFSVLPAQLSKLDL